MFDGVRINFIYHKKYVSLSWYSPLDADELQRLSCRRFRSSYERPLLLSQSDCARVRQELLEMRMTALDDAAHACEASDDESKEATISDRYYEA